MNYPGDEARRALADVVIAGDAHARAAEVLDTQIREARSYGWSLRALAKAAGLSHQTIANICTPEDVTP